MHLGGSRWNPAAFRIPGDVDDPLENLRRIACQTRIALLNDRPRKALTPFGRIAQLVEQLTLNQRVPGSSPGAPTIYLPKINDLLGGGRNPLPSGEVI